MNLPARHLPPSPAPSPDYEQLAARFRPLFARIAEGALERERNRTLPYAPVAWLKDAGFGAVRVPVEFGGSGASLPQLVRLLIELAAADSNLPQALRGHFAFVEDRLNAHASTSQRVWFERFVAGDLVGNAWTEIGTVKLGEVITRVSQRDGEWRLNGTKYYSTGSLFADWIDVYAQRDDTGGDVIAAIRTDQPGVRQSDDWDGFGQRTTASGRVQLKGVSVRRSAVLPAWKAFERPTADGPVSQIIQAAVDVGIARGAFAATLAAARVARPWTDSGLEHGWQDPLSQALIGDLSWRLAAAEALLEDAGAAVDRALAAPSAASVAEASVVVGQAKIASTEIALAAANRLCELGGTRSVSARFGHDRHWRNARTHTLHDPVRWKYHLIGNHLLNGVEPPRHAWN